MYAGADGALPAEEAAPEELLPEELLPEDAGAPPEDVGAVVPALLLPVPVDVVAECPGRAWLRYTPATATAATEPKAMPLVMPRERSMPASRCRRAMRIGSGRLPACRRFEVMQSG